MRVVRLTARAVLAAVLTTFSVACSGAAGQKPFPAPEFTHTQSAEWLNSAPLELATLRGKVVLVDGLVHGRAVGELHVGDGTARPVEALIDQLLAAAHS